jgi:hypothetical protein
MKTTHARNWCAAALFLSAALSCTAQDWSSCASDLDSMRRRASDASSEAESTDSKQKQFKSAEEELRRCVQSPQVYDFIRDGCRNKRYEYESARSAYRSQLDSLRSSLDDVDSKIRSASNSCGYEMRRTLGPPPTVPAGVQRPEQCAIYLRYKGRMPVQSLLEVCSKQMPADQCRKCLE